MALSVVESLLLGVAISAIGLALCGVFYCRWHLRSEIARFDMQSAVASARFDAQAIDLAQTEARLRETLSTLAEKDRENARLQVLEAEQRGQGAQLQDRLAASESRLRQVEEALTESSRQNTALRQRTVQLQTSLEAERSQAQEKLELLQGARDAMQSEFRNLANTIFDEKQTRFRRESKDQVEGLLGPLSERIRDFEKRVEETYNTERRERFSLIKEVKNLQGINARISEDAVNLTNALKGQYKTQGMWGEVILERVLEMSGLVKGREYEVQMNLRTEDGRRRQPDVVVHLPEGKDVVVDSKVSLVAYERFCSTDDQADRAAPLKAHVQAIRTHIRQLGEKAYQRAPGVRSLDFVLMFVPIEAAFALAVQEDNELFADAFERNIVVVSPSTLLATLKVIQNIWRYEQQSRNAQEIAQRAGALYDKFVDFVRDLGDVGHKIGAVQTAYDKAHNKLVSGRGNLVRRAEQMRELGAEVSKSLPKNLIELPAKKQPGSKKPVPGVSTLFE